MYSARKTFFSFDAMCDCSERSGILHHSKMSGMVNIEFMKFYAAIRTK